MTLYTHNGRWLVSGSGLATDEGCCCEYPPGDPCTEDADCGGGNCCDGSCSDTDCCGAVDFGPGWYTALARADTEDLLHLAGYSDITFEPEFYAPGVPIPYTDACGATFWRLKAKCCGSHGVGNPCDPSFFTGTIRQGGGAGNQSPPCNQPDVSGFAYSCCASDPPP